MNDVIISGSTGYIGTELCRHLSASDFLWTELTCNYPQDKPIQMVKSSTFVHCAGIAHGKSNVESLIYQVNVDFPYYMATLAKRSGVKKFIFISSSSVYNDSLSPLNEKSEVKASSFLENCKILAEEKVLELQDDDFKVIVIRAALVYSDKAPANFGKLMKISRAFPVLPFGSCTAKRSYLAISNLCSLIDHICRMESPPSGVYNASDGFDFSLRDISSFLCKKRFGFYFQFPLNKSFFDFLSYIVNVDTIIKLIFYPNKLDISKVESNLGWTPKYKFYNELLSKND